MSEARRLAGWFPTVLCLLFLVRPATAAPLTVCPTTIAGALNGNSPTQSGQRLFRDAVAATCGSPKANPGVIAPSGSRAYDVYHFTNSLSSAACYAFTVTTTSGTVQEVAYTSYDPTNAAVNYLADTGNTSALETMSFTVAAGGSFDVAVVAVAAGETATYTLDVAGCTAEASVTLTVTGPNPSVFGESASFRASVTGIGAPPTGTVALMDGATNLVTGTLDSAGYAWLSTSSLAVGTHSIVAAYRGDVSYVPRTSSEVSQVVDLAGTSAVVRSPQTPQPSGQPSVFTATVDALAPGHGTPTGKVEFFDTVMGSIGVGTLTAGRTTQSANLPLGRYVIYAVYAGDGSFAASTSDYDPHEVASDFLVTLRGTPISSTYGTPVRFDATVSAGSGGMPTGTVRFRDNAVDLAVVGLSSGAASLTVSSPAVGAHTMVALYGGDGTHNSGLMSISYTVDAVPTTTTLTSTGNPSPFGQSVTFTGTVSGSGGIPTGLLAMYDGVVMVGSATLDSAGRATFTTSSLAVGAHLLKVAYSGDAIYAPSTSSVLSQQVDKSGATVALASSQNPQQVGVAVTFTATVSAGQSGAGTPTGNLSFFDGTGVRTQLGTAPLTGGKATLDVSTLTLGTHAITADYSGDPIFSPASSPTLSQNIASTVSAITQTATPSPSKFGELVQVHATVAAGTGGAATGTIIFSDGGTTLGAVALDNSGSAFIDVSTLSVGSHTISAAYGGDGNHSAATASVAHMVSKAPTTTVLTSSANPSQFGQLVTLSATVASSGGTPQGTVLFKEGTATLGTIALDPSGVAHVDLPNLPVGDHVFTVLYSGSTTFEASSTADPTQVVNKAATTISLTSSSNPVDAVSRLTLTATLQPVPPGSGLPTGNVLLMDGTTEMIGMPWEGVPLSFEVGGLLSVGTHDLTVVYTGDAGFLESTSSVLKQTVQKADGVTVMLRAYPTSYGLLTLVTVDLKYAWRHPTGTVTFTEGGTTLGTSGIDGYNFASLQINSLAAGAHSVTATYGGDNNYLPANATVQFVVPQRGTGLSLTSSAPAPVFGQPFTLTAALSRSPTIANVEAPQGPLPPVVGNVIFSDGQTVLGSIPIPYGSTTLTVSTLDIGWHDLSARYEGSNNYGPSQGQLRLEVVRAGPDFDGGQREGGTPDAGQDSGSDAPAVTDSGLPMPEAGPVADVTSMDAAAGDGAFGDMMPQDGGNADTTSADSNADGAGDGSPGPPPPVPGGGASGDGGCGCHMAAPSSGTGGLCALGFALGLAVRRRDRRNTRRQSSAFPFGAARTDPLDE